MHDKNITILHDWGPQVEIEFFFVEGIGMLYLLLPFLRFSIIFSVPKVIFLQAAEFSGKTKELRKWP